MGRENTPMLWTQRLFLRRFRADDAAALLAILSDPEVTAYLPMFPLASLDEAKEHLNSAYLQYYARPSGYRYAVCLRGEESPVGEVHVSDSDSLDFGYFLRRSHWGRGLITEAGRAVMARLQADGVPYITATHDVNNPASGAVMKKLGMRYRYSYRELWQPKNIWVTFRMYQCNLDGREDRVYRKYWEIYADHFVETGV